MSLKILHLFQAKIFNRIFFFSTPLNFSVFPLEKLGGGSQKWLSPLFFFQLSFCGPSHLHPNCTNKNQNEKMKTNCNSSSFCNLKGSQDLRLTHSPVTANWLQLLKSEHRRRFHTQIPKSKLAGFFADVQTLHWGHLQTR